MILISHRRNTIEELKSTPTDYGVEIDIRSSNGRLMIHHDPFVIGVDFESWIQLYQHRTLILNVKEEGLEARVIEELKRHQIQDYFFLDQSFPFLIKWSSLGERRCAVRVSEFESIETALRLSGKVDWVWVDCFTTFPVSEYDIRRLKSAGFKICIVSPELQGRSAEVEIPQLAKLLQENSSHVEAVCTKRPELWKACIEQAK